MLRVIYKRVLIILCFALSAEGSDSFSVRGLIEKEDRIAVRGASVSLHTSERVTIASTKTDQSGNFVIDNVRPGSYIVEITTAEGDVYAERIEVRNQAADVRIVLPSRKLKEVVTVTAERAQVEDIERIPQQVNIITKEQIEDRAKSVVAQAVAEEVGVQLQRTSPSMGGVFVRGLTGSKVNVFVDGVRFSTAAARGGVNTFLNLIEPSSLDRIEILRGPSSAQYGSDALGGSIQFLSVSPEFSTTPTFTSDVGLFANSADNGLGANASATYSREKFALIASVAAHKINTLRTGSEIDSRNAVTRFLGVSSDLVIDDRLPGTEFQQYGGMVKATYALTDKAQLIGGYVHTSQDDAERYDQLIGGDGNLIADLNDLSFDLVYLKYDRAGVAWFDHGTVTYSFNTQREERVNQGGNGNPTAAINHEPERTNVHGIQLQLSKLLGTQHTLMIGGEFYDERVDTDSFRVDPVTQASSVRRGRVPDKARFSSTGVFIADVFEAIPEKLRLFANVRYGHASYESKAEDSPIVNGAPLWPDDSLKVDAFTYRVGVVGTVAEGVNVFANVSRGFRAPHITDLGTLGLTGSGFEVAAPDVAGLGGTIGSTAGNDAVSTGRSVEQLEPETSQTYEFGIRFHRKNFDTDFAFYVNDIGDNIAKQALILPQGAVGTLLGDQVIIAQNANGTVLVPASPNPVLIRANFDDVRLYGVEHTLDVQISKRISAGTVFTYVHAEDKRTGLPPNIEGGTPAPEGYLKLRYTSDSQRFWIEPYIHGAWRQERLSSLDLEDRRTGGGRSVSSITNFFNNGARARGLTAPGTDNVFGTSDDFLIATGETLTQILQRVLGPDLKFSSLFPALPGYATFNMRFGFTLTDEDRLVIDFYNITDKNYRGISWGLDGPGRGIYVRYGRRL